MLPTADHLYACDYRWWRFHISDVMRDFEGQCWTQDIQWHEKGKTVDPAQWGIKQLKSVNEPGFSTKQGVVHQGKNSGYQACNLALLLGAERIILLGFDMQEEAGKRHWFGAHPKEMEVASCYPDFIRSFETTLPTSKYGLEIWNCTRRTALRCFPWYDLDQCLELFSAPAQASESQRAA